MHRANLLYIFTDEQCALAMSCAGNSYVRTPNLDALASRGVRFQRAYCAQPVCAAIAQRLRDWMAATGDTLMNSAGS